MRLKPKLAIAVLAIVLALCIPVALAAVDGATVNAGTPVSKPFLSVGTIAATGGNATELNATAETQTAAWQGFFGEVLGNITLADASGDKLYAWLSITSGTVFTSRDNAIDFSSIAAQNDCTIDEALTGIGSDRANSTFTPSDNNVLIVAGTTIAANSSCTTHTYINNATQSSNFEEIILTDDGGTTAVYATRIEEDLVGFDGLTHDFQMIVPDYTNTTTSTYYFYAELK